MTDIVKSISQLVENQFPQVYREEGPELIAFIEAYYEFLESQNKYATLASRQMFDANDIDNTLEEFIIHFKEKYLKDLPFDTSTDKRFLIKHIKDYYNSKGTEASVKLLMKLLFAEDVDVYYPGQDILKPSDSNWFTPRYIELDYSERTKSFVGNQIRGALSGATAFVESLVTKRINGRIIDVLYLTNLRGSFEFGEFVTDDLSLQDAPTIIGSLTEVQLLNGGRGNKIGDIVEIESEFGLQAKGRITGISAETGRVDFELIDGGHGYALNGQIALDAGHNNVLENPTEVFVSEKVFENRFVKFTKDEIVAEVNLIIQRLQALGGFDPSDIDTAWKYLISLAPSSQEKKDLYRYLISYKETSDPLFQYTFNADVNEDGLLDANDTILIANGEVNSEFSKFFAEEKFIEFEKIVQPLETINLLSATDIVNNYKIGDILTGIDADQNIVANASIVAFNSDTSDTANVVVHVYDGTFSQQTQIELQSNSGFTQADIGGLIEEGSRIQVSLDNGSITGGSYQVGETVRQVVYTSNTAIREVVSIGLGYVANVDVDATTTVLTIDPAWGVFVEGIDQPDLLGLTSGAAAPIIVNSINTITTGARANLTRIVDPTTIIVDDVLGSFTANNFIRLSSKNIIVQIQAGGAAVNENVGATEALLNGVFTSNGVIDTVANSYAIGYVTGQNTSSFGLHNVEGTFYGGSSRTSATKEEIAEQILRIANGLDTPSETKFQTIFDELTANNNSLADINGDGVVTDTDAFLVLRGQDGGRFDKYTNKNIYVVETDRSTLLSPPVDSFGNPIEIIDFEIGDISEGSDATFQPGSLEDEENVFLNTDIIGANNYAGVPFLDVRLDSSNSGIGFIDSVDVINHRLKDEPIYILDFYEEVNFVNDEQFTSENANGTIVYADWKTYDSGTSTVIKQNKIIVKLDSPVNDPFIVGSTITGLTSGESKAIKAPRYGVQSLDDIVPRGVLLMQGPADFANSEVANTSDAWITGKVSDIVEDGSSTQILLYETTPNTISQFDPNEPVYLLFVEGANKQNLVRLGVFDVVEYIAANNAISNAAFEVVGGGFDNSTPLTSGVFTFEFNSNNEVIDTLVLDPGAQYYSNPTVQESVAYTIDNWPGLANSSNKPLLSINTDFGYGFEKDPARDYRDKLEDLLTFGTFVIGKITSLTDINPGINYNTNPFVNVYNKYVAAFQRGDYRIVYTLTPGTGSFFVGETISQTVANVKSEKGIILTANSTEATIQRTDFGVDFDFAEPIVGDQSAAQATVITVSQIEDQEFWGENAVVTTDVIVANGVATSVEVIDSGFGYAENDSVTLRKADGNNPFTMTGTANVSNNGVGSGFWRTFSSHLNSEKRIRDNDFYQEYSYEVLSRQTINRYEDILKKSVHVAGTKMFGGVSIESDASMVTNTEREIDEVVDVLIKIETQGEFALETQNGLDISTYRKVIRS